MRKAFLVLAVALMLMISLAACAEKTEKKILGSWYTDNMQELFFSEDGTYTLFDEGGTYSVDGERITLVDPLGGAETFEYQEDGDESYIYDTDGSWVFYPYDVAYEIYSERMAEAENQRVSTVDALRDYFPGTWVGDGRNPLHDYVVEIYDDGSFKITSDDAYYEDTSKAGMTGTWTFEEDWNDQLYYFKSAYKYPDNDKTFTTEEKFYIPDWEDRDLDDIEITISDVRLHKQN